MFPEYRDLIARLKIEDSRFSRLFEDHNELDHKIIRLEKNPATANSDEIDELKRQKLKIKDALYDILRKADAENK